MISYYSLSVFGFLILSDKLDYIPILIKKYFFVIRFPFAFVSRKSVKLLNLPKQQR